MAGSDRGRRKRLGFRGEEMACAYLVNCGLSIEARNWHAGHLELDIVARCGDRAHVVEVKTRRASDSLELGELVHGGQVRRLIEAADAYAQGHSWVESIQIDLLVIVIERSGYHSIEYFPDAIVPSF